MVRHDGSAVGFKSDMHYVAFFRLYNIDVPATSNVYLGWSPLERWFTLCQVDNGQGGGGVVSLLNDGKGLESRTLVVKKDSHELQDWVWLAPTKLLKFGELWRIKAQG